MDINENLAQFFHTLELQVPRMLDRDTELSEEFLVDRNPKLCVLEYFEPIPLEIFQRSQNTLSCVDLIGTTCFENILGILRNLPHVDTLKFWNISLDEYRHQRPFCSEDRIPIPSLKTLEFGADDPQHITPGEATILSFLTISTAELSVRTLKFSGQSDWLMQPVHNEVVCSYGDPVPENILGNFIVAAAGTLENLYCTRNQECLPVGKELVNYGTVQLIHLSCRVNTTGIGQILKHQRRLGSLTFKSYNHISSAYLCCVISAIDYLAKCIERCGATMTRLKIHAIPVTHLAEELVIQLQSETVEEGSTLAVKRFQRLCIYDLSIYRHCEQLSYLKLRLTKLYLYSLNITEANPEMATVVHGTFVNGHMLPTTLRILKLRINHVLPEELLLLTSRFKNLRSLEKFSLEALNSYVITKESFLNVLQLPLEQFVSCIFKKGKLALDFIPQLYLSNFTGPDGLHWELTVSNGLVKFHPAVLNVSCDE